MGHRILYIPKVVASGVYPVEYGLMYNWYSGVDARYLAASGWRVSSQTDVYTLIIYLDPDALHYNNTAAIDLKETGTVHWSSPNAYASNTAMFNARGTGTRSVLGVFDGLKTYMGFWHSNSASLTDGSTCYMVAINGIFRSYFPSAAMYTAKKHQGYSIRLIKDSTTLSHGQTGTYTGNDGKIYRTICIGTQEWLADSLAETRFRNGDIIPWHGADPANYFTNAEWTALTTAGCAAHGNTLSNVATGFTFP